MYVDMYVSTRMLYASDCCMQVIVIDSIVILLLSAENDHLVMMLRADFKKHLDER